MRQHSAPPRRPRSAPAPPLPPPPPPFHSPILLRLRQLWQYRCRDERGDERAVRFPSWGRLAREGVPRPFRLSMHAISWQLFVLWIAIAAIPVWGQMIGI